MVQFIKLQLSGFKSFVDRTELFIEPGVTGIVGPNGCGKSNLVEGLRWAMGETSAKRMRGGEMDDVIFAGSATRPARNLAEVVLHLDNSGRNAPAMFNDHEELEVVRRIERGSGSAYRVNGKDVRARDVQLLFADAATGAHSTALVSQGRVGALINAKPTDRRALLEEAAGITGLHTRRHEAELRLRAAETNLERLDDVVSTLETQFQGLKKQARQATRYRNLADQIRRTDAAALHLEAEAARRALSEAQEQFAAAERQVAELTGAAASRATEQAEAAAALPDLRHTEAAAAAALQRLLVDRDNLAREEAQAAAAKAQAEQHRTQIEDDRTRAQGLVGDAAETRASLEREREALEAAAGGEAERTTEARAAVEAARASAARREQELGELAERIAADEARAAALERRTAELAGRLERLRRQAEDVARQREALGGERIREDVLETAQTRVNEAETALATVRAEAETAEAALARERAAEAAAREALQETETLRTRLEAEATSLAALLDPGAPGDWLPLLDSVMVATGFEAAIGAALGDDISAPADPRAPVYWETLRPYEAPPPLPFGAAPLAHQVRAPEALTRRLSQIGVVPDEATGARLQPLLAPGQRLVTREGALWRWDGFTVAADARTAAGKRLEQRTRLAQVHAELTEATQAVEAARTRHDEARTAAERAAAAERGVRERIAAAFAALNQARQEQNEKVQKAAHVVSRLSALDEAAQRVTDDIAEAEAALAASRAEAQELPDLAAGRARLGDLRADLSRRRDVLSAAQSTLDRLAREAEARIARLEAIAQEDASWTRRGGEAERHAAEQARRLEETQAEIATLAARPAELAAAREALATHIEAAEQRRRDAADALAAGETALAAADKALKAAEHALAESREARVRAEAAVAQADQALANVGAKARDRLDAGLEQLLELAELDPSQDLPARDEVEAKLARLIRERENMGPVNLRAEAEARELEQQIAGLQTERADLIGAISRLRQGTSRLNREGRERLLAAFEQVNGHFTELFVRLFGGGRAHLKLTEAEDPLDAGLEILASPPGKRLQVMSLLSGGEQALTALSLLFAVFLTNPAPICVLDEVDAPLDDANVDRFCTLLTELSRSGTTRFLVITHHRMTMARVDRLFGVTMPERGVSRLVSVDLGAAEDLRESA